MCINQHLVTQAVLYPPVRKLPKEGNTVENSESRKNEFEKKEHQKLKKKMLVYINL